jgi:hypothetical protein
MLTSLLSLFQLVDLCMLDVGSLDFTYSVLATSALYHTESEAVALAVSGYTWPAIARCVRWMSAFALALRERSPLQPKCFHGVQPDDAHHLQVSARYVLSLLLFGCVVDPDPPLKFTGICWIRNRIRINLLMSSHNVWTMSLFTL